MKQVVASPPRIRLDVRPTERELRWFAHIDRHGPQSSEFLYELTRGTHRCRDTSLRRLQALREAGYLHLPPQQRQITKADFNPYVYDLTQLGWRCLAEHKELERHCSSTGHWWHGYWVAAVSSAIEISTARADLAYISAAQILGIKGAALAIPLDRGKLIPDQLFAIKYKDGYRAFALEVDRGTEPVQSNAARKSLKQSVSQYVRVLDDDLHKHHYGLKSNLSVLWCLSSTRRRQQLEEFVPVDDRRFFNGSVDGLFPRFQGLRKLAGVVLGVGRGS